MKSSLSLLCLLLAAACGDDLRPLAVPGDGRLVAGCGLAGVYQWPLDD